MPKVYAVKYTNGTQKVFNTWKECEANVKGVKGVRFKGFNSMIEACKWLETTSTTFIDDKKEGLKIYVDGSFIKDINAAGWAYVAVENDLNIYEEFGTTTECLESRNITGECTAVMKALEWLSTTGKRAQLIHDYAGLSAWLTGEWGANSLIAKKYYRNCHKHIHLIDFVNIKGHQGNEWNEYVDKRAKEALIIFKGTTYT